MNRLNAVVVTALLVTACSATQATPVPTQTSSTPPPTPSIASPIRTAEPSASLPAPTLAPTGTPHATASAAASIGGEVTLVTHDSFAASDSVIADFQSQTGAKLKVLKGGDAGSMVNQAILTSEHPLGDVLYGVDNTFLSRALDAGIFVPYVTPVSPSISPLFKIDPQNRVTPIDFGDVCVIYDVKAVGGVGSGVIPTTINDLTLPVYKGTLVVENPATSSPGLAFMLATIARFGESGGYTWLDYWRDLRSNDVLVSSDWNDAYYNQFTGGGASGGRPLVVSYATDPAASMVDAADSSGTPGVQFIDDGCFRQMEFAGVLAGAKNEAGAQAWIDFMASPEFQSDMPLNMYVLPVNRDAQLPEVFSRYASSATAPLSMDPAEIAAKRDQWIQQWTDAVLH